MMTSQVIKIDNAGVFTCLMMTLSLKQILLCWLLTVLWYLCIYFVFPLTPFQAPGKSSRNHIVRLITSIVSSTIVWVQWLNLYRVHWEADLWVPILMPTILIWSACQCMHMSRVHWEADLWAPILIPTILIWSACYTLRKKGSKGVLKLSSQKNPQRFNKELKKVL